MFVVIRIDQDEKLVRLGSIRDQWRFETTGIRGGVGRLQGFRGTRICYVIVASEKMTRSKMG